MHILARSRVKESEHRAENFPELAVNQSRDFSVLQQQFNFCSNSHFDRTVTCCVSVWVFVFVSVSADVRVPACD